MEREEIKNKAFNYFQSGFNCAEAVSKTITEFFSKEPALDIPKVATGFGGAIGGTKCEATCGAVSGGVIALGWLFGRMEPSDDKQKIYDLASEFRSQFIDKFGSTNCQTILNSFGVQENMFKCKKMTAEATGMLWDILLDEIEIK
jgi:C_GCAxxG_C_C family probable redox protein